MGVSRYMGVDMGNGMYDRHVAVSRDSSIAFEWRFQSADGGVLLDIVTPRAKHVSARGVPVPACAHNTQTVPLERYAMEAAAGAKGRLQERLGYSDLVVTCNYIGIVGAGGIDINAPRLIRSTAASEWILQAHDSEWKEQVRARVDKCIHHRPIPLPSCVVTHMQIQNAARVTSQVTSDLHGFKIRCVYPVVLF